MCGGPANGHGAMRIAVLSDVHGNVVALEAVLADLKQRAPDVIVNLGDCVTSPLWPRETLELLDTLQLPTVRGNHDRWIGEYSLTPRFGSVQFAHDTLSIAQREALGALPMSLTLESDILAVHGTPHRDTEYLMESMHDGRLAGVTQSMLADRLGTTTASLILCGHSHHAGIAYATRNRTVLNPGSVGCPRYADNSDPFIAEAGAPLAQYAIATRRQSRWSVELVALDYDWTLVQKQAVHNGRSDWARGFVAHRAHEEHGS